jgi:hypothetical protein
MRYRYERHIFNVNTAIPVPIRSRACVDSLNYCVRYAI